MLLYVLCNMHVCYIRSIEDLTVEERDALITAEVSILVLVYVCM